MKLTDGEANRAFLGSKKTVSGMLAVCLSSNAGCKLKMTEDVDLRHPNGPTTDSTVLFHPFSNGLFSEAL